MKAETIVIAYEVSAATFIAKKPKFAHIIQPLKNAVNEHCDIISKAFQDEFGFLPEIIGSSNPLHYRDVDELYQRVLQEKKLLVFNEYLEHDILNDIWLSFRFRAMHDLVHLLCHKKARCGFDYDEALACREHYNHLPSFSNLVEKERFAAFLFTEVVGQAYVKVMRGDYPPQMFYEGSPIAKLGVRFFNGEKVELPNGEMI